MSNRAGEEATSSFNKSTNQTKVNDSTYCAWNDASAYPVFMTVYSLVFLVSFNNSDQFQI